MIVDIPRRREVRPTLVAYVKCARRSSSAWSTLDISRITQISNIFLLFSRVSIYVGQGVTSWGRRINTTMQLLYIVEVFLTNEINKERAYMCSRYHTHLMLVNVYTV